MSNVLTIPPVKSPPRESLKKVLIEPFKVAISVCTQAELFSFIVNARQQDRKVLIDNVNMDILWYAQKDHEYRHILNALASATLVDGIPVCWLASLAGIKVPERLALTDVVPAMLGLATKQDYTVFVLGSNPETLATAKKKLREKQMLPHTVACWAEPRKRLENPDINADVLHLINEVKPDILFVAMGSPWQTHWINRNWDALPNCVVVPVGGAFDYIAGTVGRAPTWMQKTGTEWIYRLLLDHQKRERSLFQRYIMTDIPFAFKMAMEIKFGKGLSPHPYKGSAV